MWEALLVCKRNADMIFRIQTGFQSLLCVTGTRYSEKQLDAVARVFSDCEEQEVKDWIAESEIDPDIASALTGHVRYCMYDVYLSIQFR